MNKLCGMDKAKLRKLIEEYEYYSNGFNRINKTVAVPEKSVRLKADGKSLTCTVIEIDYDDGFEHRYKDCEYDEDAIKKMRAFMDSIFKRGA